MAGLRVVRGPDWKYGDQDGGEGNVGTIKECQKENVTVIWDNGEKGIYRKGPTGQYDLRVIDNGPAEVRHKGIICCGCDKEIIYGIRWNCTNCSNENLCTKCYGENKHSLEHGFKRYDTPKSKGVDVGLRVGANIFLSKGIFKGAEVVRGDGWQQGDQDDGGMSLGAVKRTWYKIETGSHIFVATVRWEKNGKENVYSLGWRGRVDIKYLICADGWTYYPDHLPLLGDENELYCGDKDSSDSDSSDDGASEDGSEEDERIKYAKLMTAKVVAEALGTGMPTAMKMTEQALKSRDDDGVMQKSQRRETRRRINKGDLVCIRASVEELRKLQHNHGGFDNAMKQVMDKIGIVQEITTPGDVKVFLGGNTWSFNPKVLKRIQCSTQADNNSEEPVDITEPGAIVRLITDVTRIEKAQYDHGGWSDKMKNFIGRMGIVKKMDSDGDIEVCFGKVTWTLNADVLIGERIVPNLCDTDEDNVVHETLERGQIVRLLDDMEKVERMQQDHRSGWSENLKEFRGRFGIVQRVDKDGDGHVSFGTKSWYINPASVTVIKDGERSADIPIYVNSEGQMVKKVNSDTTIKAGDLVRIDEDEEKVKQLHHKHAEWVDKMRKYLGKRGIVEKVVSDKISVCLGEDTFWYHAKILTKLNKYDEHSQPVPKEQLDSEILKSKDVASKFHVTDIVQLHRNTSFVKEIQKGHGEWNSDMEKVMGKLGIITAIDREYDIRVCFGSKIWCVNSESIRLQARQDVSPGNRAPKSVNLDLFKPGKFVKLIDDGDEVQALQEGKSIWNNSMYSSLGKIGIVCRKINDDLVSVHFGKAAWQLNKAALIPWEIPVMPYDEQDEILPPDVIEASDDRDISRSPGSNTGSVDTELTGQSNDDSDMIQETNMQNTDTPPSHKPPPIHHQTYPSTSAGPRPGISDVLQQHGFNMEDLSRELSYRTPVLRSGNINTANQQQPPVCHQHMPNYRPQLVLVYVPETPPDILHSSIETQPDVRRKEPRIKGKASKPDHRNRKHKNN